MNRVIRLVFSLKTALILLLIFAVSIAWATFIENDFGTATAKQLVYASPWFELLLWLIAINLIGNMFIHRLFRKEKLTILTFHLSFVLILVGGAITHYFGYEGTMHIREGKTADFITLRDDYLKIEALDNEHFEEFSKKVFLPEKRDYDINESFKIKGKKVKAKMLKFISNAEEIWEETDGKGDPVIDIFVLSKSGSANEYFLKKEDRFSVEDITYSFNEQAGAPIVFRYHDNEFQFKSVYDVMLTGMMTRDTTILSANQYYTLQRKSLYDLEGQKFVIKSLYENAQKTVQMSEKSTNKQATVLQISSGSASKIITLLSQNGVSQPELVNLNNMNLAVSLGKVEKQLPFKVALRDFIIDRYPGSMSPSSYASEVTLLDEENDFELPFRIFMNHILKYKGFRFFQSSYDQDEKGTILSVSHDQFGAGVTYAGYLLMGIGMLLSLFNKKSRFGFLSKYANSKAKILNSLKAVVLLVLFKTLLTPGNVYAQSDINKQQHFEKLNTLLVQNQNGRIEPISTIASDVLRKIYKKEKYYDYTSTEVIVGILSNPSKWEEEPLLVIKNEQLADELNATDGHISFSQMFKNDAYVLKEKVSEAYHTPPSQRNKYNKEVIKLDERVNIFYQILNGSFLKLFPVPNDDNNTWANIYNFKNEKLGAGSTLPTILYQNYLNKFSSAELMGNYTEADQILTQIINFQRKYGAEIVPSERKVKFELAYLKLNVFNKLAYFFQLFGLIMLVFNFMVIFKPGKYYLLFDKISFYLTVAAIIIYTLGLVLRWYISGHAPWSNGYEAMVFIGWATAIAGLTLSGKSHFTLSVTNILSGIMLMTASMSWMNPQITPLVPVLKSYWLIIHVAVITSSYGFLAIASIIAFLSLILILVKNEKNNEKVTEYIFELRKIIEIALIIGLYMLSVGTFLGGVWANESWGRYWGWDPKETWALITMLIYAIVAHLPRIPFFKSNALYSGITFISFSSVLMTFLGVNYFLSGLHSYANGEAPPIPSGVFYGLLVVVLIILLAYLKEKKYLVAKNN